MDKQLNSILYPYLFVLKEGKSIKEDMLDYSLLLLHLKCGEIIKTPRHFQHSIPSDIEGAVPIKAVIPKLPRWLQQTPAPLSDTPSD